MSYYVIHRGEFIAATTDVLTAFDRMHEIGRGAQVYRDDGELLNTHPGKPGRTVSMTFYRFDQTREDTT